MIDLKKYITNSLITILLACQFFSPVLAEELVSPNYKLIDPTISGGSNTASSANYQSLSTLGDFSANPSMYSDNYKLDGGTGPLFEANVPLISCFETTTDGTSSCTTGPSYLNTNGMVTVCGLNGCFNRARFEIDPQGNPTDTLYGIQISTSSNFIDNIMIVDGSTLSLKSILSKTINDYKTKSNWETSTINILGLRPQTTYYIRATALHGDLTESLPGPFMLASTSLNYLSFDIDISDVNHQATNSAPYSISLFPSPEIVTTSNNLIWLNVATNNNTGIEIFETGLNGGLKMDNENIIHAYNVDLNATSTGFGLRHFYSRQNFDIGSGQGELATTSPEAIITKTYLSREENVANIPIKPDTLLVYSADGPLHSSESAFYVATKVDYYVTSGKYSETITIILTAKY